ncbi:MAG: TRAP transporter large permease [Desulfuromonadaceae bacterium]|nr:TRAP transporter large permease [Desulfuromonadaceae bacterium]
MIASVIFIIMLLLFALGMPVGFAMGVAGVIGLFWEGGLQAVYSIMSNTPFRSVASINLSTVPLFIFMAEMVARGNIASDVFGAAQKWIGKTPGGLAYATVAASAGMGAMSGSSVAAAASLSSITIPEMRKAGYDAQVAAGVVTVAGTLAIMIPPSIPLVIYGIVTETSTGKLLMAGILPGILTAVSYCIGILLWRRFKPGVFPDGYSYSWKEKFASLKPLWAFLILGTIVIVTLYSGIGTSTEAAAVGAMGAAVITVLSRRATFRDVYQAALSTAKLTTMIFTIIVGAMILGYFFTLSQTPQNLVKAIGDSGIPAWGVMGLVVVLYLFLGCVMDQVAVLLLTLPLTFPLVTQLGFDAIWFGIIVTKLAEIGLITPPVGMNAYVVSATAKIPLDVVFRGTVVMLAFEIITMIFLLAFPIISTWIPSLM